MNKQQNWSMEFEPVRRQRARGHRSGGRGTGHRHGGPGGFGGAAGPPPWLAEMFGPQWGGRRGGGRSRVRRGDVRGAILDRLAAADGPLNGYQLIQAIAERTDGAWKPSPGSVYPTIAQLLDEGLIEDAPEGRKAVRLSEAGAEHTAEHAEELTGIWASFDDEPDAGADDLRQVIRQTVGAIVQVATTGTPDQWAKAAEILGDTRRRLYGVLAEGPDAEAPEPAGD